MIRTCFNLTIYYNVMFILNLLQNAIMCFLYFFFFQAEDGIRDLTVTGVQTCALPICETFGRALRQAALEGFALARKAFAIESGIVVAARARAMRGKSRLVRVDKGHALARGIAAALLAARQRPDPGQKLLRHEVHRLTQALAVDGEGRVHVEAIASARARRVGAGKRGVAVAHVADARQISTDQRLERGARLGEIAGQLAIEHLLRILDRGDDAAAIE